MPLTLRTDVYRHRLKIMLVVLGLVVCGVAADQLLMQRFQQYRQLTSQFECYPLPCSREIVVDGEPRLITISEVPNRPITGREVFVSGRGAELLRIPYDHTDNTFRTHIAVVTTLSGSRLVVYDGSRASLQLVRDVYQFHADGLRQVAPTDADALLLDAMAATDDTGTFHTWILYDGLRKVAFGSALALLLALGVILYAVPGERRAA